ncbi:MAG: hypothetical protein N2504_07320 [candidate division WOR-3 bacterium]|nr:hypothetical protein [candidate division WOR-3 bacterium]MCX7948378.1 hypothetical protein [candidate division WOR-3 bacterium]MDW8151278.1 hypothetical protein [candidate division WOR-3 bacterium]
MNIKGLIEIKQSMKEVYNNFEKINSLYFKYMLFQGPRIKFQLVFCLLLLIINIMLSLVLIWIFLSLILRI